MPPITDEMLTNRLQERLLDSLEREKRNIRPLDKARLERFIPLVEEMAKDQDQKETLAMLLDQYLKKQKGNHGKN